MNHFWNWTKDENSGERTLYLDGVIAEESWFGDEATPTAFRDELMRGSGPVIVKLHSPGGDCIAASQIYSMLMEYPGEVTVKIDALAASAASVIAMAGARVCMSPTALMMVHEPWTSATGNSDDMRRAIALLDEVKESIINAYALKTRLPRGELSRLMQEETWMNANKAKELGFCDEVMYADGQQPDPVFFNYSPRMANLVLLNKVKAALPGCGQPSASNTGAENPSVISRQSEHETQAQTKREPRIQAADLMKRLSLLR